MMRQYTHIKVLEREREHFEPQKKKSSYHELIMTAFTTQRILNLKATNNTFLSRRFELF